MKYRRFLILLITESLILLGLLLWGHYRGQTEFVRLTGLKDLVTSLMLTDLSIWTEARYTRHPSQTDLFSAFQDCPGCLEHFPSGSIVSVPPHLRRPEEIP